MAQLRRVVASTAVTAAASLLLLVLVLPLLGLVTATNGRDLIEGFRHPLVWPALQLTALTTSLSLGIVVGLGTPLAWRLARHDGRFARALETLVQLPVVVPPAVAGVAMLIAFGRHGLLAALYPEGWSLAFTTAAVVLAQVFVSAPFFVQAAISAFRRLDARLLDVGRSLGASPWRVFLRIAVPLSAPGLIAGTAMSWARSLGEFGATLMFAGNITGRTQTLPLAVYSAMESDLRAAQALALLLIVVAFVLLVALRTAATRLPHHPDRTRSAT